MVFSSLLFIFGFLPLVLFSYYISPARFKNAVLLFWSFAFYAWGAPKFLLTLLFVSYVDYLISYQIVKFEQGSRKSKLWLALGIVFNVSLLFYFKYSNFFVHEVNALLGSEALKWTQVIMPIGVSFVVFEEISYIMDVYRRVTRPAESFPKYLLFLFLFPHSIAGPIFRWKDLTAQLSQRSHSWDLFYSGATRFLLGLGKKVLIADKVALAADLIFKQDPNTLPASYAWIGMVAYTLQIYFDFSGYSDMAIGLGLMFGFRFKENFNAPYISQSITEFWQRWHISLSSWMRDYLYIPLGGNRHGAVRTYINLVLVFLVSGFWHGANWTFLAWGAFHGFFLILDRMALVQILEKTPKAFRILLTMFIVMIGWVLFRSDNIHSAVEFVTRLFAFTDREAFQRTSVSWGELLPSQSVFYGFVGIVICSLHYWAKSSQWIHQLMKSNEPSESLIFLSGRSAYSLLIFTLVILSLASSNFSPFIYFRF